MAQFLGDKVLEEGNLPWSSPGSVAGGDVGSHKEGRQPLPPGLFLPPWRPWNTQSNTVKDEQVQTLDRGRAAISVVQW